MYEFYAYSDTLTLMVIKPAVHSSHPGAPEAVMMADHNKYGLYDEG